MNKVLLGTSLSFIFPLIQSMGIKDAVLKKVYLALLSSMTVSSCLVHSGVEKVLVLDKTLIYLWIVLNSRVLFKIKQRTRALFFGIVVLVLGVSRWYQRHFGFHALMHLSGAIGTFELIRELKKMENILV